MGSGALTGSAKILGFGEETPLASSVDRPRSAGRGLHEPDLDASFSPMEEAFL